VLLDEELEVVENLEHLQLQREEALFLVFGVGCLDIYAPDVCFPTSARTSRPSTDRLLQSTKPFTLSELWSLFVSRPVVLSPSPRLPVRPDDPFLVAYVVYHHYRSLGWVVRSGVKFCTDWVLYKGADGSGRGGAGPVGGHAECVLDSIFCCTSHDLIPYFASRFSVVTVPTYQDPEDEAASSYRSATLADSTGSESGGLSWRWLSNVNRVSSGVKKVIRLMHRTICCITDPRF
jgi:tRNA-splicing endonuclease subunit Sen2